MSDSAIACGTLNTAFALLLLLLLLPLPLPLPSLSEVITKYGTDDGSDEEDEEDEAMVIVCYLFCLPLLLPPFSRHTSRFPGSELREPRVLLFEVLASIRPRTMPNTVDYKVHFYGMPMTKSYFYFIVIFFKDRRRTDPPKDVLPASGTSRSTYHRQTPSWILFSSKEKVEIQDSAADSFQSNLPDLFRLPIIFRCVFQKRLEQRILTFELAWPGEKKGPSHFFTIDLYVSMTTLQNHNRKVLFYTFHYIYALYTTFFG